MSDAQKCVVEYSTAYKSKCYDMKSAGLDRFLQL